MAGIGGGANFVSARDASTTAALIALGAGLIVTATGPIRLGWIGTTPRGWVTAPGVVALIGGRTGDGSGPHTTPRLATVRLGTGVGIVTNGTIRQGGVRTLSGGRIARPRPMTLVRGSTGHRVGPGAAPRLAGVGLRAGIAI